MYNTNIPIARRPEEGKQTIEAGERGINPKKMFRSIRANSRLASYFLLISRRMPRVLERGLLKTKEEGTETDR